jgi:hypothetical protein
MKKNDCKWEKYKLTIESHLLWNSQDLLRRKDPLSIWKTHRLQTGLLHFVCDSATPTPKSQSAEEEEQEANNPKRFNGVAHSSVAEFSESQSL